MPNSVEEFTERVQEEKILRALRAKRRFKAIVHHVIHNLFWLLDEGAHAEEDAKPKHAVKRIIHRHARKHYQPGSLTINEKAILRKHPDDRSLDERKLINKYLGGLKCFRRYPEEVQYELVSVTYFDYFGPDRVLVKQDHEALAMYFILSGEVIITREIFDEIEHKWVSEELGKSGPGSTFGEVSLLHNVKRTATVTTASPCEMLILKKDDFNRVLKVTIQSRWDEIHDAMLKFNYFNYWDDMTIRECCILSKIKCFETNQIILGDGVGRSSQDMVYFVISGKCSVIEHLFISESVKHGVKSYRLYKPPEFNIPPEPEKSEHHHKGARVIIHSQSASVTDETKGESTAQDEIEEEEEEEIREESEKIEVVEEKGEGDFEEGRELGLEHLYQEIGGEDEDEGPAVHYEQPEEEEEEEEEEIEEEESSSSSSSLPSNPEVEDIRKIGRDKKDPYGSRLSRGESRNCNKILPSNVKLRFMQICTFGEKASFMNNKLMAYRRVIAVEPVKCILIPVYWLRQHNEGNMWTRVSRFLQWRVPSREEVFKKYIANKKWAEYKKKLVHNIIKDRKFVNTTTIHDVPYSIRVTSEIF